MRQSFVVAAWVGLVLVAVFAYYLQVHPHATPFPDRIVERLAATWDAPWELAAAECLNVIGQGLVGFVVLPLLSAAALWRRGGWRALLRIVSSTGVSLAAAQYLKHSVERVRPAPMLVPSDLGSFPSGHVANIATLAMAVYLIGRTRPIAVIGVGATVVMTASRIDLNVHWFTDTVAATVLGAAISVLTAAMLTRMLKADPDPTPPSPSG